MHGDVKPTPIGNPSTHAGIIPRVLFRLFHELETSYTDFVVKISYIELYNEELRDLLGNDLPPTNNSVQPMGMAAKDAKDTDGGLKIFDEAGKRGVLIQGLEEIVVKDSKSVIALLTKGSEHKQIAATKFRMHNLLSAWVTAKASTCLNGYLSFYFAVFRSGFITESLQLLVGSGLDKSSLRIEQITGGHQNGAWAITDWVPIIVKSSLVLGVLPLSTGVIGFV